MSDLITAPAVVEGLPAEIYHAHPASSNSSLKSLPDNPEEYYALHVADPKPAWAKRKKVFPRYVDLGTAFHSILLEGKTPPIIPECLLASNGACTTKMAKAFVAENPDYVKQAEYDDLMYARDRCYDDPAIRPFLETKRRNELSLFWQDHQTQEFCRGRIDSLCEFTDGLWILDAKFGSADPTDEDAIGWKIFDMGYENAGAMYWDAVEALIGPVRGYVLLFVLNSPPYKARLWELSENDLEMGRRHYHEKLFDLKERRETGNWHGPRFGQQSMTKLPRKAWDRSVGPATPIQPFSEFLDFQGET
jgi:hypothetical protein